MDSVKCTVHWVYLEKLLCVMSLRSSTLAASDDVKQRANLQLGDRRSSAIKRGLRNESDESSCGDNVKNRASSKSNFDEETVPLGNVLIVLKVSFNVSLIFTDLSSNLYINTFFRWRDNRGTRKVSEKNEFLSKSRYGHMLNIWSGVHLSPA